MYFCVRACVCVRVRCCCCCVFFLGGGHSSKNSLCKRFSNIPAEHSFQSPDLFFPLTSHADDFMHQQGLSASYGVTPPPGQAPSLQFTSVQSRPVQVQSWFGSSSVPVQSSPVQSSLIQTSSVLVRSQFGSGSSPGNGFGFRFSPILVRSVPVLVQSSPAQFSSVPFWFNSVSVQFSPVTFRFSSVQFSSILVPFRFSSVQSCSVSVQFSCSVQFSAALVQLSSVQSSPVQFKMVSKSLEKPTCPPGHLRKVSLTLPLKQFQSSPN